MLELKIGYIQTSPVFGDKEKNFSEVEEVSENVNADLLVLPELFATGYTFISKEEAQEMAEPLNGKTSKFLQQIAEKTSSIIIGGFIEKDGNKLYNSSLMVSQDKVFGSYRKIHLYNKEKLWFSPGNRPFQIYETNKMKIGMMICFDWLFPESIRSLALLGADVIAHSANLVLPYCQNAMKVRCLENRVFAVTANRIGREQRGEDDFTFTGESQITDYKGEVLSAAPKNEVHVDVAEINPHEARSKDLNDYNNLVDDRKPDLYEL
ncbi:MAG: nitrilase-related carbon-nitrogen hydrolase [Promethearchaeia archaeon]